MIKLLNDKVRYQIFEDSGEFCATVQDLDTREMIISRNYTELKSREETMDWIKTFSEGIPKDYGQSKIMSELGKKSWEARKGKQDMRRLAKKRWGKESE